MSRSAKPQNGRRRFLRDVVRTAGGLAAVGVALGLQQQTARASGVRLRPPGAINENAFASACVRCGQCVQACPYDTLKLATLASGLSAGTPYFVARDIPCEMCEDIPCAKVCPSGALDREIESIDDVRMGLAVLVDQENCLNFQGLRCDVCYRECPKIDEAITIKRERTRPLDNIILQNNRALTPKGDIFPVIQTPSPEAVHLPYLPVLRKGSLSASLIVIPHNVTTGNCRHDSA